VHLETTAASGVHLRWILRSKVATGDYQMMREVEVMLERQREEARALCT
jgi:hypothetical protein